MYNIHVGGFVCQCCVVPVPKIVLNNDYCESLATQNGRRTHRATFCLYVPVCVDACADTPLCPAEFSRHTRLAKF